MKKIIILYSGGLDSFILKHWASKMYPDFEIECIYYDYGNPICETEKMYLPDFVTIKNIEWFNNSTDQLIAKIGDEHKGRIYIAGRNLVFSILAGCQELPKYIFMGGLYEECHPSATDKNNIFLNGTSELLNYVLSPFLKSKLTVRAPFVEEKLTKIDVMQWALDNGISLDQMANTISCFNKNDLNIPCGECHSCIRSFSFFQHFDYELKFIKHPFMDTAFGMKYLLNSILALENSNYDKYLLYDVDYEAIYNFLKLNTHRGSFEWVSYHGIMPKLEKIIHTKSIIKL